MEKIALVLWLVLFPLACTLEKYIHLKIRGIKKEEPHDDNFYGAVALVQMVIFITVPIYLFY